MTELNNSEAGIRRERDRLDLLAIGYSGGTLLVAAAINDVLTRNNSTTQAMVEASLGVLAFGVTEIGRRVSKTPVLTTEDRFHNEHNRLGTEGISSF